MRIIKLGLISAVLIFILVTLISLLFPSQVRISKAINLPRGSAGRVWTLVRDTAQWPRWLPMHRPAPGEQIEPIRVVEQRTTDTTTIMTWQQGSRQPLITGWQVYHPAADSLTLQWYMDIRLGWQPWKKFGSLFFESTYGKMMQQGLENIRAEVARDR